MQRLMPEGDCQHSGTFNGHAIPVSAAIAAVRAYREPDFYKHIETIGERLEAGLAELFNRHSVVARVQRLGARFGVYFGIRDEVRDHATAKRHDRETLLRFIACAIEHGVYFSRLRRHSVSPRLLLGDVASGTLTKRSIDSTLP